MEALLADYRGKCAEENAVRELLEKARFDTQQLRIRLRSSGIEGDGSLIPSNLRAGGVGHLVDSAFAEHKSLLEWLAEVADASHLREFYAPGEVAIGDLQVTLGRMVQLRLSRSTGVVKLNVPVDFVHEFLELLSKVRRGDLRQAELGELAAWKLVSVELTSDGDAQPAIFLIHPVFSHAVVVSSWPTLVEPTAMQTPCPATVPPNFHPEEYFGLVPVEGTAATDCGALGGSVEITFLGGDGGPVLDSSNWWWHSVVCQRFGRAACRRVRLALRRRPPGHHYWAVRPHANHGAEPGLLAARVSSTNYRHGHGPRGGCKMRHRFQGNTVACRIEDAGEVRRRRDVGRVYW
jgi:hypothetical protein